MGVEITKTFQDGATAMADGNAALVNDLSCYAVQLEGISGDTITIEGTLDGSTWYSILSINPVDGSRAATVTADGIRIIPCAGLNQIRCRISTYSAGTITVTGRGSYAPWPVLVTS